MAKRRVVVTGLGLVSPVGNSVSESWENVCAGHSGIRSIDSFDASAFSSTIAGLIRDFDIGDYMPPKEARKCDPFIHYGIAASAQAMADCGLTVSSDKAHRYGVMMGSGIGGISTIEANHDKLVTKGPRRISPFFVPASIINMISGHVSMMFGMTGPNLGIVTACTTSTHSIGLAARLIQHGDADVILAGGAEHAATPVSFGGFCAARALSKRNDEPERASRPWDSGRDGFVLSDGAGCLVLEDYDHAAARGAKLYAELIGFGMSADAHHITDPAPGGRGAKLCMQNALADAEVAAEDIDYINAHGTSTLAGDRAETDAIKGAFGEHAYELAISSTKSTTGHMIGAAGAAEAIFSIMALRDQMIPPTINLEDPDPDCDLDYTPNTARRAQLDTVLSNSFGFGGTNGTVVFRRTN